MCLQQARVQRGGMRPAQASQSSAALRKRPACPVGGPLRKAAHGTGMGSQLIPRQRDRRTLHQSHGLAKDWGVKEGRRGCLCLILHGGPARVPRQARGAAERVSAGGQRPQGRRLLCRPSRAALASWRGSGAALECGARARDRTGVRLGAPRPALARAPRCLGNKTGVCISHSSPSQAG